MTLILRMNSDKRISVNQLNQRVAIATSVPKKTGTKKDRTQMTQILKMNADKKIREYQLNQRCHSNQRSKENERR